MSKTTLRKRISLVAVTALTAGVLSVVAAPVANANIAASTNATPTDDRLNVAVGSNTTGAVIVGLTDAGGAGASTFIGRSLGLLYKDASSTTAQTATVASTGGLVLYTLADASTNIAFVASGGAFGTTIGDASTGTATLTPVLSEDKKRIMVTPGSVATAVAVSWSTTTVGTYTISAYQSTATTNIQSDITLATSGTLIGAVTVSVVASSAGGTVVPSNSTCVTDNNSGGITSATPADSTAVASNGTPWYIKYALRDAYLSNMDSGNLVATATNGALISIGNGTAQAAGTTSTAVQYGTGALNTTYSAIRVDQPTAGAPLTTTVTLTYNGTTVCTKTVTIRGAADKIIVSKVGTADIGGTAAPANWLNDGTQAARNGHFYILLTDSAGNIATPAASTEFSPSAASLTTTVTNIAVASGAIATSVSSTSPHAYSTGTFTCGPVAGTSKVTLNYTNASTGKIISTSFDARCADAPSTYTASFDKASYRQGEIGTLTMKFLDSKGNAANSVDPVGASQLILPMLTLVSATGAATTITDAKGEIAYTFTVGTTTGMTAGTYTGIVDFTALTAVAATKATPTYTLTTGGDQTTNAEVLKSIVALIASINKQIQALQKLILKR
jgi:hypothetical protein